MLVFLGRFACLAAATGKLNFLADALPADSYDLAGSAVLS